MEGGERGVEEKVQKGVKMRARIKKGKGGKMERRKGRRERQRSGGIEGG